MLPRVRRPGGHLVAALCLAAAAGCGGSSPTPAPEPAAATPDACIIPTGEPGEPRELVVATNRLDDSSDVLPRQPVPLVRLDCTGVPRPAAAVSWTADSAHRTWTFVLAPSALGITAGSVAVEWRARPAAATLLRQAGVSSVTPLDERRLMVTMDWASDTVPPLFSDPALSLITDSLTETGTTFVLRRNARSDLRDALDAGADIVRSGDPAIVEYARNRPTLAVHPLPWSRTYLLLLPADRSEFEGLIPGDTADFRAALARDAVRAEARGAERSAWWNPPPSCPASALLAPPSSAGVTRYVAFPAGDEVAQALAERVVALSDDPDAKILGIAPREMPRLMRTGSAGAYVIAVPRAPSAPCVGRSSWPPKTRIVPLIDTRLNAIVRRGVPSLTVDYDGRIRPADAP